MNHVFVIALDSFNRRKLEGLRIASECRFHRLVEGEALLAGTHGYDVGAIVEAGRRELQSFDGSVDAILAYRDFPESTLQPILAREFGTPSASLEAVLKCEHKYWSRLEQYRAIPDNIPRFVRFHPFSDDPLSDIPLEYPFWMKPVKSFASHLGFMIRSDEDFERALRKTRAEVRRLAEPFDRVLERVELPESLGGIGEVYCLAESIIGGRQCTLEGCVYHGQMHVLGIVDSIRRADSSSFARYQYPSQLPDTVQARMTQLAERLITQIGYDNAGFNMEFFWDESSDQIWFLEINPRIALHHTDLFEKVDGFSNYEMAVRVALGREPALQHDRGQFGCAATFFLREREDAWVSRAPSPERVAEIEQSIPGTLIELRVKQGQKLSDLAEQDAYSYALALIYIGGKDQEELLSRYEHVVDQLGIELDRNEA